MSEEVVGDGLRARLQAAGKRLATADAERRAALGEIAAAMKDGRAELNIKEMAEMAGVSRVTAYRLLEK